MSLSDFMPYGAPELIDGAAPRMARATMMASGFVAVLVWCLGLVATSHPVVRELKPEFPPIRTFEPRDYVPEHPPGPRAGIRTTEPLGDLRPVVDEPVQPTIDDPAPVGPVSPERGEPDEIGRGNMEDVGISDDPLPTEFVSTDEYPQLVRGVTPLYPDLAREAGVEGTVKLQLLVGLDGRVLRAIVRQGGSVPMLDEAAIQAALQCVFTPALTNGRPVKVWVSQDYRFKLH
jgi:protein TonB